MVKYAYAREEFWHRVSLGPNQNVYVFCLVTKRHVKRNLRVALLGKGRLASCVAIAAGGWVYWHLRFRVI